MTAVACLTASGGFWVSPAAADTTATTARATARADYTLTMQETLALYGATLSAQYQDYSNNWHDVEFQFMDFLPSSDISIFSADIHDASTGAPAYIRDYITSCDYLVYAVDPSSWMINQSDLRNVRITANFSIDIQDIDIFHQMLLHSYIYQQATYTPYNFATATSTNAATPINFTSFYYTSSGNTRLESVRLAADLWAYNSTGNQGTADFAMNEIIVNTGTGGESFSISAESMSFVAPQYVTIDGNSYFLILIGCPTITEGYYSPDITTTTLPEYMPILSEMRLRLDYINIDLEETNERLRLIQAQLQAIYNRMLEDGEISPDLVPAATIPRILDQYYSGIVSGAPSASGISAGASGASIVPLSDIISVSGMGSVFGLLVGLCCAGWVLTTGRKG